MRIPNARIPRLVAVLSLTLLVISPNVIAEAEHDQSPVSEPILGDDVCEPLYAAEIIFQSLQASPNAHLDKKIVSTSISSQGWGDGLGWAHNEGPLSTTFRLLPRLLNFLRPSYLLSRISPPSYPSGSGSGSGPGKILKITKARKRRVEEMLALIQEAEDKGCDQVWAAKGKMRMFAPKGVKQDLPAAFQAYKRHLEKHGDAESQFMLGLFYATGLGGVKEDQGKALLYYTFSALQGFRPAEMALGYRHWGGISVQESCPIALDYYEAAALRSYETFLSGPPGGLTLPLTTTRLTDRVGGVYGPQASWASTGANAFRAASKASLSTSRGETEQELIEYFQYHSDRNSHAATIRLGRYYYTGSIYSVPGGLASGGEGAGEVPQNYAKAKEYFTKVARAMWPMEYDPTGKEAGRRRMSKEMEDNVKQPAMVAAAFLGRMALRGEGGKPDYKRAKLWLDRAAELGEREALNNLGIIYRDGMLVPVDKQKAYKYFQAAAGQDLAEAQVNLAKMHLERNQVTEAMQYLESALRHGSPFEAFHLYASIHASIARQPIADGGKPGFCGAAVAWYKLVAERGSWDDNYVLDAERAWARGEEGNALVGWMVAAEMGNEAAQNNLGWLLERGVGTQVLFDPASAGESDMPTGQGIVETKARIHEMAMRWWIRSAAQDNVDAMVKVGDYYYAQPDSSPSTSSSSSGGSPGESHTLAAAYYQTAADTSLSAMAYWNLGWMYENGIGVKRDWWLAKRSYDQAGEMGGRLPVVLSLAKLYLRSWYIDLVSGGTDPGLNLFEKADDLPSLWTRVKSLFTPLLEFDLYDLDEDGDGEGGWEDQSGAGSGWEPDAEAGGRGGGAGAGARRAGGAGRAGDRGDAELDEVDDILETLIILGVMAAIATLVMVRQRWEAVRMAVGV